MQAKYIARSASLLSETDRQIQLEIIMACIGLCCACTNDEVSYIPESKYSSASTAETTSSVLLYVNRSNSTTAKSENWTRPTRTVLLLSSNELTTFLMKLFTFAKLDILILPELSMMKTTSAFGELHTTQTHTDGSTAVFSW